MTNSNWTRRRFLSQSVSCGAYIAGLAAIAPRQLRAAFQTRQFRDVVTEEKWGRIELVAEGVWAVISTPFEDGDYLTVANGGIIAGSDGVLVVEAFMDPKGAAWVAEWAEKLTKRWPTDVAVTHYHADHAGGASGYEKADHPIRIWATDATNRRVTESRKERPSDRPSLDNVSRLDADRPTEISLGDRSLKVTPRQGHTASDVVIELSAPHVVWCGDLYFNRMIPNYMDALPEELTKNVGEVAGDEATTYVPGHGSIATHQEFGDYHEFLKAMEETIRGSFEKGLSAEQAASEFKLPSAYEDYYIFSPQVVPRMVNAWYNVFQS